MPTCMGSSPAASSAVSMDVDGIDSSFSPVVAPRRRVHPCGLVALDALLGGDFPCRALSQVFLVSVIGLPMRSHVDYDFIGLLLATHSDRRIYIIDAGGLLCVPAAWNVASLGTVLTSTTPRPRRFVFPAGP